MQLWAADGQISAALAQYERCKQILDQELGAPPHPFTTELYEKIHDGVWQLPTERTNTLVAAAQTITHNLPRLMAPLIGRENEFAQLQTLLGDAAFKHLQDRASQIGDDSSRDYAEFGEKSESISLRCVHGIHSEPK